MEPLKLDKTRLLPKRRAATPGTATATSTATQPASVPPSGIVRTVYLGVTQRQPLQQAFSAAAAAAAPMGRHLIESGTSPKAVITLWMLGRTLRNGLLLVMFGLTFVLITALLWSTIESKPLLVVAGTLLSLGPLPIRGALSWLRRAPHPATNTVPWLVVYQLSVCLLIGMGFSETSGRALRRSGDWFLGEAEGLLPRRYKRLSFAVGLWLENLDRLEEHQMLVNVPQGEAPASATVAPPRAAATPPLWIHPLAGPERVMPPNPACRFGAPRPGTRPTWCVSGHCGIDLPHPVGTPIHAVFEGQVIAVAEDARSGRYVQLAHKDQSILTTYIHLEPKVLVKVGDKIRAGQKLGTIGLTGVLHSAPHLHLDVRVKDERGTYRHIDPEPYVASWALVRAPQ